MLPDEAFTLFVGLKKSNTSNLFFELTPILRSHADFYEKKYGLILNDDGKNLSKSIRDSAHN